MFCYTKDKNGNIEQVAEINGNIPAFMADWEKTEETIIRLYDGTFAFAKDVDMQEEEQLIVEQERKNAVYEEINRLKQELSFTDYKCLKYIDGALSESDYAEVKANRAELRRRINELEDSIK